MDLKKAAIAAGVYFCFGVMALLFMTMAYGRPAPAAFLVVAIIPLGILATGYFFTPTDD